MSSECPPGKSTWYQGRVLFSNSHNIGFYYLLPCKNSWPELQGVQGEVAEVTIERENTDVDAVIVLEGSEVITDFRCDRVWVWVDENGIVTRTPTVG